MSYSGTMDIMHDKARFYTGNSLAADAKLVLTKQEIEDEDSRVHYHSTLKKGQNTVNACIARLAMRYIAETNANQMDGYDPDEFLQRFVDYMVAKPDPNDLDQLVNHNDVYLDIYIRYFFEQASLGKRLRDCAKSQRDVSAIRLGWIDTISHAFILSSCSNGALVLWMESSCAFPSWRHMPMSQKRGSLAEPWNITC